MSEKRDEEFKEETYDIDSAISRQMRDEFSKHYSIDSSLPALGSVSKFL